jgi:NAD(P)H-hydrate epimerase
MIHSAGGRVKVYILGDPSKFKGAARTHFDILNRLPVEMQHLSSTPALTAEFTTCDVIVDAIFGTGLTRDVEGLYSEIIEGINASQKTVVSVDIPSGVNGDTGRVMGTAIRADFTVTFGLPKLGNLLFPGCEFGGKLYVSHISFPPQLYTDESMKIELNRAVTLPPRPRMAHKGDFGNVLFIAGAATYYGAPYFSAMAFLKAGGGYARLAAPAAMIPFLANKGSEIVFVPQRESGAGSLAADNKQALLELASRMDMVVIGPGLSLAEETQHLMIELVREITTPLLIDGDGITAVCRELEVVRRRQAETILTPHLGEMSRLTSKSISDLDAQKIDTLQQTARDLGAVIVLKGAHSLIGYPDDRVWINLSGNPGMATPGSGDVLNGIIAAMYGMGLGVQDAVRKGVFIHGLAGDLAAADIGEDGVMAQDILEYVPRAMKMDRDGIPASLAERYGGAHLV